MIGQIAPHKLTNEMREIAKLDWFPLYIHRLKASKRWQAMTDYQRGWYICLLIEAVDSERLGYLPNDRDSLWILAGAKTKAYFQREGQSVLSCFDGTTEDGRWIYNSRLLEVLEDCRHWQRRKRKPSVYIPTASDSVVEKPVWISQEIWDGFWEMRAKHKKKPPDTPLARKGIIRDVSELRMRGWDPNDILQNSITNGWVGVFEPRQNDNGTGTNKKQQGNRAAIAGALRDLAGEADGRNSG